MASTRSRYPSADGAKPAQATVALLSPSSSLFWDADKFRRSFSVAPLADRELAAGPVHADDVGSALVDVKPAPSNAAPCPPNQ